MCSMIRPLPAQTPWSGGSRSNLLSNSWSTMSRPLNVTAVPPFTTLAFMVARARSRLVFGAAPCMLLRSTLIRSQLCDALGACTDIKPVYRRLLKMMLEQLQFLEQQIGQLDQEMASLLNQHQDAVKRLAEGPGLGGASAQQITYEG